MIKCNFDKHIIQSWEYEFIKDSPILSSDHETNLELEIQHSIFIHKEFTHLFLELDVDLVISKEEVEFRSLKSTIDYFYEIAILDEEYEKYNENEKYKKVEEFAKENILTDVLSKTQDLIRNFTNLDYNVPIVIKSVDISTK